MMDYEILTVKGTAGKRGNEGWVMQVNNKLYSVQEKHRHLNRTKLLALFAAKPSEFKPYVPVQDKRV